MAYREKFREDVLIDLVGYRRHGHNEGDEPNYTQPQMYQRIRALPTVQEIYAASLAERGVVSADAANAAEAAYQRLVDVQQVSKRGWAGRFRPSRRRRNGPAAWRSRPRYRRSC